MSRLAWQSRQRLVIPECVSPSVHVALHVVPGGKPFDLCKGLVDTANSLWSGLLSEKRLHLPPLPIPSGASCGTGSATQPTLVQSDKALGRLLLQSTQVRVRWCPACPQPRSLVCQPTSLAGPASR